MTSLEFRTNPLFLRNGFETEKKWGFPIVRKQEIELENIDNCGLVIKYINKELIKPYSEFKIIINPSYKTTYYDLGDYYQVLYNEAGIMKDELYSQSLMINPLTLVIVVKK